MLRYITFFIVSAFVLPIALLAQVSDPVVSAQAPIPGVGHHYIGIGAEIVNPADGSLTFDLPIQTPPGRQLSLPIGIHYSSPEQAAFLPGQTKCTSGCSWYGPFAAGDYAGWSYGLPVYIAQAWVTGSAPGPACSPYPSCQTIDYCWGAGKYVFSAAAEGPHPLNLTNDWPDPNNGHNIGCSTSGFSTGSGGNGVSANLVGTLGSANQPALTVVNRAGTVYQFGQRYNMSHTPPGPDIWTYLAQSITDRNGNQLTLNQTVQCSYCGLQPGSYTDTLGRKVVSWTGIGNSAGDQLTVSGLGGNVSLKWLTNTFYFWNHAYFDNGTNNGLQCQGNLKQSAALQTLGEIDLPNGQKYTFVYGGAWGRLQQINFPDGGYVRYVWGVNTKSDGGTTTWVDYYGNQQFCSYEADTIAITDRYVSFDGSTEVLHQTFSYATNWAPTPTNGVPSWTFKGTVVTSTDLLTNQTSSTSYTYAFVVQPILDPPCSGICNGFVFPSAVPLIPVETQVQDTDASGIKKTINKTWADQYGMIGEQTILDNGQGITKLRCLDGYERVLASYEYGFQTEGTKPADQSCATLPQAPHSPFGATLSYGLNTAAMGPLRRQTSTTYHSFPSSSTLDAPASMTVYDGSGNQEKLTNFGYDESGVVSSGAQTGLVAPPGSRGNVTSISRWLNTTNSYAKTTYTYYDTGNVASMTDPCGNTTCSDMPGASGANHTTTYSYTDNFASGTGTAPGQTNAFLTTVTDPNTGVAHAETFTWGYADGLLRSSNDQNQRTTNYQYDTIARLTQVSFPDGGQTNYAYNDAKFNASNNTPNVTTTKKITSGLNEIAISARDGMGHVVRELMPTDPDGPDTTDTTYDGFGRVWKKSNPHRSSTLPTDGTAIFLYDGLDRPLTVTQADGSIVSTTYSGNCSTNNDEAGKTRTSCTDSLGRLSEVDEPGTGELVGTPGTGSVTITGTEQSTSVNGCPNQPYNCWYEVYDGGSVFLTVNGFTVTTGWGGPSDPPSIAAELAAALNVSASPVTATASGGVVNLTSTSTGTAANYSFSASVCCWNTQYFSMASFTATASGATLTGGSGQQGNTLLVTLYNYDALGNLKCAVQKGSDLSAFSSCSASPATWRPRSFVYDSLSRLTTATNPESGTISYGYDANGNVSAKVAPMPNTTAAQTVTTSYSHDSLNRLTAKSYSDGTATVQYGYDSVGLTGCTIAPPSLPDSYPIGRRTTMCDGSGSTSWDHDQMGRIVQDKRFIGSISAAKFVNYGYNLDGSVAYLTTPPIKTLTSTYNGAGRLVQLLDMGDNITFGTSGTYAPTGQLTGLTVGGVTSFAGFTIANAFNSRGQPTLLSATAGSATVFSESFDFHLGAGDNGNVYQIVNNRDNTRTQNFTYDALNRVASGYSSGSQWGETFTIDSWGNLTNRGGVAGKTNTELLGASAGVNNQLSGFTYDAAGNMIANGSASYAYDAENRLIWTSGYRYVYDGDGARREKCAAATAATACPTSGTTGTLYWKNTSSSTANGYHVATWTQPEPRSDCIITSRTTWVRTVSLKTATARLVNRTSTTIPTAVCRRNTAPPPRWLSATSSLAKNATVRAVWICSVLGTMVQVFPGS